MGRHIATSWGVLLLLYTLLHIFFYKTEEKQAIKEINDSFIANAFHWGDSIYKINSIYSSGSFNSARYKERHDLKIINEKSTLVISADLFHPEDHREFLKRKADSSLLNCNQYDLPLADSLWNTALRKKGLEVDAAIMLYTKDLREMFPQRDIYIADVPAVATQSRAEFPYTTAAVTDSVKIGILDHGTLVGYADIPMLFILKRMSYPIWGTILLLLLMGFSFLHYYFKATDFVKRNSREIIPIGTSLINMSTRKMICKNGSEVNLPNNPFKLLNILLHAPDCKLTKEEVCNVFWPERDLRDCASVYHSLLLQLRKAIAIDSTLEIISVPNDGIQLAEHLTRLDRNRRKAHHLIACIKKRIASR